MSNYLLGYGIITPWGIGEDALSFETDHIAREKMIPPIQPAELGWKGMNRFSHSTKLCCVAIGEALKQANQHVPLNEEDAANTGIVIGTSLTNLEAIELLEKESKEFGVKNVNPGIFPNTVLNVIGGHASIYFNVKGTNITISEGDMAGPKSLLYAMDLINNRQLDRVIVCQCNVFPPQRFEKSCDYKHSFESVNAVVLERSEQSKSDVPKIEVEFSNNETIHNFDSLNSVNFLLAMVLNARKLSQYNIPRTQVTCDMGEEGVLKASISIGNDCHV